MRRSDAALRGYTLGCKNMWPSTCRPPRTHRRLQGQDHPSPQEQAGHEETSRASSGIMRRQAGQSHRVAGQNGTQGRGGRPTTPLGSSGQTVAARGCAGSEARNTGMVMSGSSMDPPAQSRPGAGTGAGSSTDSPSPDVAMKAKRPASGPAPVVVRTADEALDHDHEPQRSMMRPGESAVLTWAGSWGMGSTTSSRTPR